MSGKEAKEAKERLMDAAALLAQLREMARRAAYKRYRPINCDDDVVEMSGSNFDALLVAMGAASAEMERRAYPEDRAA